MGSDRSDQTIKLKDGRTLGYAEYGAPEGKPVFYFHGFPGSRLDWPLSDAQRPEGTRYQLAVYEDQRVCALDDSADQDQLRARGSDSRGGRLLQPSVYQTVVEDRSFVPQCKVLRLHTELDKGRVSGSSD